MPDNIVLDEIEIEVQRIEKLFVDYKPLIKKTRIQEPDFFELGSLAMLLHSFYNGVENIFHRIARKIDNHVPAGEGWHKELLEQMTKQTNNRIQPVLSINLCEDLKEYLGFRHFSRHAYAFDLSWELMKELIERINEIKSKVIKEVQIFISYQRKKNSFNY